MFTALLVALEDAATPADVVAAKLQEAGPRLALLSKAFAGPDATGRAGLAAAAAKTPTWLTVPASDQQAAAILLSQLLVRGLHVHHPVVSSPAPLPHPLPRRSTPCHVAPPPALLPHPLPFLSTPCPIVRPPALSLLTRPCRSQSEPARRRGAGPAACLCPHQGRRTDPERWARVTLGGPRSGISARPGRPPASPRTALRGAAGRAADPHHRASELLRP